MHYRWKQEEDRGQNSTDMDLLWLPLPTVLAREINMRDGVKRLRRKVRLMKRHGLKEESDDVLQSHGLRHNVDSPSAVSIMLERLCPRVIPRTTAVDGRSTRGPLAAWATAVTSGGGTLFSEEAAETQQRTFCSVYKKP